jgi:hypothetical protein
MLQQEIEQWVDQIYEQRQKGAEFTQLRKTLEENGLVEEHIKQIINAVNERELENLDTNRAQLNPNILLVLAVITFCSAFALAFYINKITNELSYQFLNAIPVAGSVVLFYNYYRSKQNYKR